MSFFDQQFPPKISLGAIGGPDDQTHVTRLGSGVESRRAVWAESGGSWTVSTDIKDDTTLHELISFRRNIRGSFRGFRWKDWQDYTSGLRNVPVTNADQSIGPGDGTTKTFSLTKAYTFPDPGGETVLRPILKPVVGTILVAVNAVGKTEGTDFIVDYSLGLIHFFVAPPDGESVTWGGEFDVPARLGSDKFDITGLTTKLSRVQNLKIVELKPVEVIGVDIDFTSMLTTTLPDSRLTLVRESQGSYFNSAGVLKFALNNEPRPWHNNTAPFAHRGIIIEEARTIRITKNRDMGNDEWTKTSIDAAMDAVGLDGIVNTASTLTATGVDGTVTKSPTLGSLERTYSLWVKRKTGSGTITITDDDFSASTVDITSSINSSTFTKVEITSTRANPIIGIKIATNTDAIEVDFNQLEDGAFSTSPIDSDIFTVRQADDLTFNDTSWINNVQGTMWCDCSIPRSPVATVTLGICTLYDASSINNRVTFNKSTATNKMRAVYEDGATPVTFDDAKVWSADAVRSFIFDYEANNQALFTDGTSEATDTDAGTPTGMDICRIGRSDAATGGEPYINGFIELFRYIPIAGLG